MPISTTTQTPSFTQSFQQRLQSARQAAAISARKTLQRAQKLETPYIPTSSSKDSASKALKRADRFGGYQ